MNRRSFVKLGRSMQLTFAALVLLSLALVATVPPAREAQAASCPPPWSSCTAWAYNGTCCCCIIFPGHQGSRQIRQCTWWDYATNAYPTCTYKVVHQETQSRCVTPVCQ